MEAVLFVLFPENNIFSKFWFDKNLEEEEKKKKKEKRNITQRIQIASK